MRSKKPLAEVSFFFFCLFGFASRQAGGRAAWSGTSLV